MCKGITYRKVKIPAKDGVAVVKIGKNIQILVCTPTAESEHFAILIGTQTDEQNYIASHLYSSEMLKEKKDGS